MAGTILLIDDDPAVLSVLSRFFEGRIVEVCTAVTGGEGVRVFERHQPEVVLVDLNLPDMSGLDVVDLLRNRGAIIIMLTGAGDIPTAVEAVKRGAENFLTKPVDLDHLGVIVDRGFEKARLIKAQTDREWVGVDEPLEAMGGSPQMRQLARRIERAAQAEHTTILLQGESGTGKGWVARRIHELSPRSAGPFVEVNCATLTGTFLENELFGHERGAFTDAKSVKRGLFEVADGGTIFLDEIGELELGLQPKLLNVLESHTFRRIGGTRQMEVDVRLIAASNADLREAVETRVFRADLFYRLNVMPVELPPLRKRSHADIAALAQRIIDDLRRQGPGNPHRISPDALEKLVRYEWPGNIRELRNSLERARILAAGSEVVEAAHLTPEIWSARATATGPMKVADLKGVEREHIARVLAQCSGNRTRAAELLGIARATLHNKIKRYRLDENIHFRPTTNQ